MITWILVTICSINFLNQPEILYFINICIYWYIRTLMNHSHCWKCAGRWFFCTLGAFGSHFSGSEKGFVSSICDLWSLWPFIKSSRPVTCDQQIDLIAAVIQFVKKVILWPVLSKQRFRWCGIILTTTTTTTTITWFRSAGKQDLGSLSLAIAHLLSTLTLNTFGRPHYYNCFFLLLIFIFIFNLYFNFNPTSPIHDHAQCYTRCASTLYSSLLNHPYPTTCLQKMTQTLHVPFHLMLSKTHMITIRLAAYNAHITHSTTEALCKNHGTIKEHIKAVGSNATDVHWSSPTSPQHPCHSWLWDIWGRWATIWRVPLHLESGIGMASPSTLWLKLLLPYYLWLLSLHISSLCSVFTRYLLILVSPISTHNHHWNLS